jgi:hypothetical protein
MSQHEAAHLQLEATFTQAPHIYTPWSALNLNVISRFPLIRHPQDQTGVGLSNILAYLTVPIQPNFLQVIFFSVPSENMHLSAIFI